MENKTKRPMFWPGIKALLTVEKVLGIIAIVTIGISIIGAIIDGAIYFAFRFPYFHEDLIALRESTQNIDSWINILTSGFSLGRIILNTYFSVVNLIFTLPFIIVSLTFVNIVLRDYPNCPNKKAATKYGVLSIVAGFLGSAEFAYVAAALIFVRKASDFPDEINKQNLENEPQLIEQKEPEVVNE